MNELPIRAWYCALSSFHASERTVAHAQPTLSLLFCQVFFRLGVHSLFADSPARNALLDTKKTNHKTAMPCHACEVSQDQLSDGRFDVDRFRRTDDRTEHSLEVVGGANTNAERRKLSMKHGVNDQGIRNPLREHVPANLTRSVAVDVFHQSAQNSSRKVAKFFFRGLSPKHGQRVIACILGDVHLRPPGAPPFRDIVRGTGGFASQSGMDVWRLMSVLGLVMRPALTTVASMVRCDSHTQQFVYHFRIGAQA